MTNLHIAGPLQWQSEVNGFWQPIRPYLLRPNRFLLIGGFSQVFFPQGRVAVDFDRETNASLEAVLQEDKFPTDPTKRDTLLKVLEEASILPPGQRVLYDPALDFILVDPLAFYDFFEAQRRVQAGGLDDTAFFAAAQSLQFGTQLYHAFFDTEMGAAQVHLDHRKKFYEREPSYDKQRDGPYLRYKEDEDLSSHTDVSDIFLLEEAVRSVGYALLRRKEPKAPTDDSMVQIQRGLRVIGAQKGIPAMIQFGLQLSNEAYREGITVQKFYEREVPVRY